MEGPIDFDIWCKLKDGLAKEAAAWTAAMHSINVVDAFKTVRHSQAVDGYIQIFVRSGWDDIPAQLQVLPEFVHRDSAVVTESSYSPSDCKGYCETHMLRYIRSECPVCSGFYISHVIDGRRILASSENGGAP